MRKYRIYTEISIKPDICVTFAIAILLVPIHWLLSWCCAVIVHELCHWVVLHFLKLKVVSVRVSARGIMMGTGNLLPLEELLCAAAGPIGSLLLLLTAKFVPMIAICGFLQGLYNLLPVLPLDGGRILRALIELCLPGREECVMVWTACIVRAVVLAGAVLLFSVGSWMPAVIVAIILVIQSFGIKFPCKDAHQRVQ